MKRELKELSYTILTALGKSHDEARDIIDNQETNPYSLSKHNTEDMNKSNDDKISQGVEQLKKLVTSFLTNVEEKPSLKNTQTSTELKELFDPKDTMTQWLYSRALATLAKDPDYRDILNYSALTSSSKPFYYRLDLTSLYDASGVKEPINQVFGESDDYYQHRLNNGITEFTHEDQNEFRESQDEKKNKEEKVVDPFKRSK